MAIVPLKHRSILIKKIAIENYIVCNYNKTPENITSFIFYIKLG